MKEILQRNFLELKDMNVQTERVHWVLGTMTRNWTLPRHIMLKFQNIGNKEKYIKTSGEEEKDCLQRIKKQKYITKKYLSTTKVK